MKRLVFVNSNTKLSKIKAFMHMKGIEKYTLLESSRDFREELLINAADIFIFDYYGDIQVIESLMDFVDHVNELSVYAESIHIGKMYSRLSENVFVLPDEIDLFMHFWETPACTLKNALLSDVCDKPTFYVRRPEGLIVKTKKMQVLLDQTLIPVRYMNNIGKAERGKVSQLQVTLKPRGWFVKPEVMVRHQSKFGERPAVEQTEYTPLPVAKPELPVKPTKPAKPVKEKPTKEKKPKPPKPIKEPRKTKRVAIAEDPVVDTVYVKANEKGSGRDHVQISDEFDNTLILLDNTTSSEDISVEELSASIDGAKAEDFVSTENDDENIPEGISESEEETIEEPIETVEESVESAEIMEETALAVSEQKPKKGLFGGLFCGSSKKEKKSKNERFFEKTDVEWGSAEIEDTQEIGYAIHAYRAHIITKIEDYMLSEKYLTPSQKQQVQEEFNRRQVAQGGDIKFGDIALEMGFIEEEKYCDCISGFRNIEVLHWAHLQKLPVVVDRFNRESYSMERFFETSPTVDGRVRIIASVNSKAIDEKIRKYAEGCVIQYTIDSYITKKLKESEGDS